MTNLLSVRIKDQFIITSSNPDISYSSYGLLLDPSEANWDVVKRLLCVRLSTLLNVASCTESAAGFFTLALVFLILPLGLLLMLLLTVG